MRSKVWQLRLRADVADLAQDWMLYWHVFQSPGDLGYKRKEPGD